MPEYGQRVDVLFRQDPKASAGSKWCREILDLAIYLNRDRCLKQPLADRSNHLSWKSSGRNRTL
jgi:hypothetical protein